MTELKPCPFCGNEPEAVKSATGKILYIKCLYCLINKRIDSWNTRHYPAEVQQAIDKQNPKKVIYDDSRLGKPGITEYSLAICPSCKQSFIFDENATEFKCCPNCGQRLDWEY